MESRKPPGRNHDPYIAIIGMSALLCFAWLLTSSLVLTLMIIVLGLLHLARHFPEAEAVVSQDPILLWIRRASPMILIGITTVALVVRYLR